MRRDPCEIELAMRHSAGVFNPGYGTVSAAIGSDPARGDHARHLHGRMSIGRQNPWLVNNAIPEMPAGGTVTIRGEADTSAGRILLEVADTGRGMPDEVKKSLFTVRVVSRKPGGTGLGTKIVKDVVDVHRGRISVESVLGKGATFHIQLPIAQS